VLRPARTALLGILAVGIALLASGVVAALGPEAEVVCGRGHVLDRLAQAIMHPLGAGHIDGASASFCAVPSTTAWPMAAAAFVAVAASELFLLDRRRAPVA
jgi:hypothetical protein